MATAALRRASTRATVSACSRAVHWRPGSRSARRQPAQSRAGCSQRFSLTVRGTTVVLPARSVTVIATWILTACKRLSALLAEAESVITSLVLPGPESEVDRRATVPPRCSL